jgi:hypothetical protein
VVVVDDLHHASVGGVRDQHREDGVFEFTRHGQRAPAGVGEAGQEPDAVVQLDQQRRELQRALAPTSAAESREGG